MTGTKSGSGEVSWLTIFAIAGLAIYGLVGWILIPPILPSWAKQGDAGAIAWLLLFCGAPLAWSALLIAAFIRHGKVALLLLLLVPFVFAPWVFLVPCYLDPAMCL